MKKYSYFFTFLTLFYFSSQIFAQNFEGSLADSLAKNYEFESAIAKYKEKLQVLNNSIQRTIIEKKIVQCENGLNMLQFAFSPKIVAKSEFSKDDFFLHYPGFKDSDWILVPTELIKERQERSFMYFPKNAEKVFFSLKDNSGFWNIYTSKRGANGLWSQPQKLNDNVTSYGDELFPIISADGKSLYFSSNGHYGMGGFDLYVSHWDENLNDWGLAQNLGFPYSSPANDFLYYNTPCGLFTIFASDRNNTNNLISVYASEFENIPLKKSITATQARKIALLQTNLSGVEKKERTVKKENNSVLTKPSDNGNEISNYNSAIKGARRLQQEINETVSSIEKDRELYNQLIDTADLLALQKKIEAKEAKNLVLRDSLNKVSVRLQNLEMEFLSKDIIINNTPNKEVADSMPEESVKSAFTFVNNKLGTAPAITLEAPEIDLSTPIKFTEETIVHDFNSLPNILVYQIQLASSLKKLTVKQLKNINPVFEKQTSDNKFIYTAGVFKTYSDVLKNLAKVKRLGFPMARIVAFDNKRSISLPSAQAIEKKSNKQGFVYQVVILGYTDSLPEDLLSIIKSNTEKDIAKLIEGGVLKFIVGPFSGEDVANVFANKLKAVSNKSINVEKIEKK